MLISLVSVVPAAGLVGWLTSMYLTSMLLERERQVMGSYVRQAVATTVPEGALRELGREETRSKIRTVGQELLRLPEAVRVKVFDARGTIVWSDEEGLVGYNFFHDHDVKRSLSGAVVVKLEKIRPTAENVTEIGKYRELSTIYVPIIDSATGKLLIVFEVYKRPDLFLTWIHRGQVIAWLIAFGVGGLLLLAQFSLVRRAARTIARQHGDLERRSRQLESMNVDLRAAQRQLLDAERLAAFGEAAVAVAHGLRSPLANARAVAQETLESVETGNPLHEPLGEIMAQVDRLEARIRAFLDSTRPFDLTLTMESLGDVIGDALTSIHRRLAASDMSVRVDVDEDMPPVLCDRVKVAHAIQELLANSIEADARHVRVRCGVDRMSRDGAVRIRVEDDGRGVEPATQARAFDQFFTTKAQGTGIGLPAVRRIVEAHGGSVSIAPGDDGGAVVDVRLPVARRRQDDAGTPEAIEGTGSTARAA